MIEEGDTDIIRGELVDNVVGRPVKHHVRDLLYIRHCLLENNELYVQLVTNIRSIQTLVHTIWVNKKLYSQCSQACCIRTKNKCNEIHEASHYRLNQKSNITSSIL